MHPWPESHSLWVAAGLQTTADHSTTRQSVLTCAAESVSSALSCTHIWRTTASPNTGKISSWNMWMVPQSLAWSMNTMAYRIELFYFIRRLIKFGMDKNIPINFYRYHPEHCYQMPLAQTACSFREWSAMQRGSSRHVYHDYRASTSGECAEDWASCIILNLSHAPPGCIPAHSHLIHECEYQSYGKLKLPHVPVTFTTWAMLKMNSVFFFAYFFSRTMYMTINTCHCVIQSQFVPLISVKCDTQRSYSYLTWSHYKHCNVSQTMEISVSMGRSFRYDTENKF